MLHMLWFVARGHCIVMGTHWRHTLEAHIRGFPPIMSTDVMFGCMDLPRQGCPLFLGEGSGCAENDVQPIQRSLVHDNESVPQILQALLVQPICATIPSVHAIAPSPMVDIEGGDDDNNGGESSRTLQFFGSQLLV